MDNGSKLTSNYSQAEKLPYGLELLDTAMGIAKWNNEAHAIGLKVLEEREREEKAKQEQKARSKRPMISLNFAPVLTAKAVVAENVAKLYLLVQKRNITPIFEFTELGIQSFGATLRIHDKVFTAEGPFASKKEAKETVAKFGVEFLTKNPDLSNPTPKIGGVVPFSGQGVVAELNLRCQKLKIVLPEYVIPEISKGQFSATITIGSTSFEEKGPFTNKKLAKEAVAKHGLAHLKHVSSPAVAGAYSVELGAKLQSFVDRHRLDPPRFEVMELRGTTPLQYRVQLQLEGEILQNSGPFLSKQEATNAITVQGLVLLEKKYTEENWVELLNLFSQSTFIKQPPIYEDFQETSTRQILWSSEVIIPLRPESFGRRDLPFGSKKLARQNAAREAILWLREHEYLPEDGVHPKKKQKIHSSSISSSSSPFHLREPEISYAQQVNGNRKRKQTPWSNVIIIADIHL